MLCPFYLDPNPMDKITFWQMNHTKGEMTHTDNYYNYYTCVVNGYRLMYATNKFRPDGQRHFIMGDEFAKCLGFLSYEELRRRIPGVQYWRRMLTTKVFTRRLR